MAYGPVKVYTVSVDAEATESDAATMNKSYAKMYLQIPTMPSGSVYLKGSHDGSTYARITKEQGNTATVHADFLIDSSVSLRVVPIPQGLNYYKVEMSTAPTAAISFKIICAD